MNSKPTVALVLDSTSKTESKLLKIRVTYNREPHQYSVNSIKKLTPEQFKNDKLKVTKEAKEEASKSILIANEVIDSLGKEFTFSKFRQEYLERLYGKKKDPCFFSALVDDYLNNHTLQNKTISSYKTAARWVERYKPNIKTRDMDDIFVKGLISFIKEQHQKEFGKDISENTVRIYLRPLRAIFTFGIEEKGITAKNPFVHIKGQSLSSVNREKTALSDEDLKTLFTYEPKNKEEHMGKDFFIMSLLLCGMNIGDILSLRNKNINGDTIRFIRRKVRKSGVVITFNIVQRVKDLLCKYGVINSNAPNDYILPYLNGLPSDKAIDNKIHDIINTINKGLSSICTKTGMEKMTTYNARHTYAVYASSDMGPGEIQKLLGHTSSGTTDKYLRSINKVTQAKNDKVLQSLQNIDISNK